MCSQRSGEGVEAAVEPGGEVVVGIEDGHGVGGDAEAGDRHEAHEGPVADEQRGGDGGERAGAVARVPDGEADEAGDEVADGDAGEDSEDAQVGEVEVGERAEEQFDGEDDGGRGGTTCRARVRLAAYPECRQGYGRCGRDGKDDGDADEEEEVGEDEVGEGEAVPFGVVELGVDVVPVAGIVDEDHERDGEAAEDVDGEDA